MYCVLCTVYYVGEVGVLCTVYCAVCTVLYCVGEVGVISK